MIRCKNGNRNAGAAIARGDTCSCPVRAVSAVRGIAWVSAAMLLSAALWSTPALADQAPSAAAAAALIPRSVLFGNPDRIAPQLSVDGSQLAYLAPVDGVLNVWVAPAGDLSSAKAVTKEAHRGIRSYFWAYTGRHILYRQDKGGDENWRIYCVDLDSGEIRDLTPFDDVQARVQEISPEFPEEVLLAINKRSPQLHDVYRVNIRTGELGLVAENMEGFVGFLTDQKFNVRFGLRMTKTGGQELLRRDDDAWKPFLDIAPEDTLTTQPIGFDESGATLYMTDSRGRDTAAVVALPIDGGPAQTLAAHEKADASGTLRHPTRHTIQAVSFDYERATWTVLDPAIQADLDVLKSADSGDVSVVSRTLDDSRWVVAYSRDAGPTRYYHYSRADRKATLLFSSHSALDRQPLVPMTPVQIPARDGLTLVSYLSLPAGESALQRRDALPMVLLVHGGPWARDGWGYNPLHQWLANRGYAVLSVNFRGSTGFGKSFANAGNLEWAGRMHDDLVDAVQWAVQQKIADPKRVAIMGGSYGGYATLVGLTSTPELFACGVDIVGPSNLVTLLNSIPPYWTPMIDLFTQRVGDHRTEDGRKFLMERSPLTHVQKIVRPLLIGQGANDPRVKQAESDQIVEAMRSRAIPVTYVLYPDEGHGFARPENRMSFYAVAEAFLAQHLGGRAEPIGDDFRGSSIQAPAGAEHVPGLKAALGGDE